MYAKHGNVVDADASGAKALNHVWRGHSRSRILGSLKSRRATAYYCIIIWSLESEMSEERSEHIRFLEPHCHLAPCLRNPANICTNVILWKLHSYAFIFVADCVNVCVYLHLFFCGGLESRMRGIKQQVLLSRTWDSRTRTRTRGQALRTRTRTRTRTWKLVLEDKDFPREQQHCKHRVSNKRPRLPEIQTCRSTSHTLVTSYPSTKCWHRQPTQSSKISDAWTPEDEDEDKDKNKDLKIGPRGSLRTRTFLQDNNTENSLHENQVCHEIAI